MSGTTTAVNPSVIANAIGVFLSAITRDGGRESFWFQIYCPLKDRPENLPDKLGRNERTERKTQLKRLQMLSLSLLMGLDQEEYDQALDACKLVVHAKTRWGMRTKFRQEAFRALLHNHELAYTIR